MELHHPELIMDNYQEFKKLSQGIKRRKEHNLDSLGVV